ncbi:ABC transporter ATP-binding protein [Paracoccus laeviglucosivorans]|uniref:Carbohydrate ABC transporter ATP-binding protein, CUT1 family n=1 Tax=Paracoccus laeviglucosivorans TaxID=1197861 RepID=A0A521FQA7_9RHOB|nr:ABC transporter ATP-binding protein [Paracoccus laeviglucosivorans]SMO97720.1 carbohydrate ABC transporter ATP-binding protein, CUT1 family [Paracoccus laeviglucosivorans]
MPQITLGNIRKSFGSSTVIPDFSAQIEDGEFLVLLGPSGCGKSTLLRMIAGLSDISGGDLRFDGTAVNEWTPSQRGVAFVFQSYALYPHMTVRENIAFPLIMDAFQKWYHIPVVNSVMRWKLMRRPDIAERTDHIARQLELTPMMDRRPANLSGGQRQRVALARSLVRDPSLYLLDEPLSNLDAKLRTQMRSEISALHKRVKKTFIYVTHDQVEAMTMATKIIVMNKGEIQQIGTPDEIYANPANTFVARFVGAPPMNLLNVRQHGTVLSLDGGAEWTHPGILPTKQASLGIRPENLNLRPEGEGLIPIEVSLVERLGAETLLGCRMVSKAASETLLGEDLIFVRVQGNPQIEASARFGLSYAADDVRWYDQTSGQAVTVCDNSPLSRCA